MRRMNSRGASALAAGIATVAVVILALLLVLGLLSVTWSPPKPPGARFTLSELRVSCPGANSTLFAFHLVNDGDASGLAVVRFTVTSANSTGEAEYLNETKSYVLLAQSDRDVQETFNAPCGTGYTAKAKLE